jgi:methionyl aminopeptidase
MINYKTPQEIEIMRQGGKILADVLWEVMDFIKPGVTEIEIDELADRLIAQKGGEAGFKKVDGYKYATCISTNNVVVHGIPTDYKVREGDIVGVDCGVLYKGFNTDMSHSVRVKSEKTKVKRSDESDKFLEIGEKALNEAIKMAIPGNRIGHISKTIQDLVEGNGYSVVRSLIGHGVGKKLHEDPEVPGFLNGKIEKTPLIKPGMTIAIEVIYNMGSSEVSFYNKDGWTIGTSDGSLSGLFERTVAITDKEFEILTK